MSILVTEKDSKAIERWERSYLLISLFCFIFGAVYEQFSHEVYSGFMLYAFSVPLIGGTLLCILLDQFSRNRMPGRFIRGLYHSGIAALTVGCIFQGVLEIYGTTNKLMVVYWIVGFCLTATAAVGYGFSVLWSSRWKQ